MRYLIQSIVIFGFFLSSCGEEGFDLESIEEAGGEQALGASEQNSVSSSRPEISDGKVNATPEGKKAKHSELKLSFSSITVKSITSDSGIVAFKTNLPSSCEIEYGLSKDSLSQIAINEMLDGELTTVHDVALDGLKPDQKYYVRAKAIDERGEEFFSSISHFRTEPKADKPSGVNLLQVASYSIADVSSNWQGGGNHGAFGASQAFDGNTSTEWSTDGDGDAGYVKISFEKAQKIAGFGFRSRKMSDGTSIVRMVEVSVDGVSQGEFAVDNPDRFYNFDFEEIAEGQEVELRFVETTGGNTGAREIKFFSP